MCALARELSASGLASLRFDFSGNGESQGVFSISGYDKEVADVASAVAHARGELGLEVVAIAGEEHARGGGGRDACWRFIFKVDARGAYS
eukprot:211803-Chlamydomonas_euryale.AAC.1